MVNLKKGERINLTKGGLKNCLLGLGWDINRYDSSSDFDLDLVIFECNKNGKTVSENHFIFYKNLNDPEKAIQHAGDNRTGAGDGDDEQATVNFEKLNSEVQNIVIAVTIYEAKERNQNFGMVSNSYIRIIDTDKNEEVGRYELCENASTNTAVVFAELYKSGGDWKFRAVGQGYNKDLADLCREYGLDVE